MNLKDSESLKKKVFYTLFISFILVNIIFIVSIRLLPFIDLPQHLAYATIYKHIGEPGNFFSQYFEFDSTFLKYNTVHPIFCSLDILGGVETANKIYFIFYIILLPLSIFLFIKKLGGNYWMSLLTFLFMYNFNVCWGFVGFMMAIPFIFFALMYQYEYLTTHSLKSIILLPLFFIIIYHLHLLAALFILGLMLLQHILYHRKDFKSLFFKGLIYLPLIILIVYGVLVLKGIINGGGDVSGAVDKVKLSGGPSIKFHKLFNYYTKTYWSHPQFSIKHRIFGLFAWDNYFLFKGMKGVLVGSLFSIFTVLFLFWPLRSKINSLLAKINEKREVFVISILVYSLLIYFFIISKGYIFSRFTIFIFLGIIILGSILKPENKKVTVRKLTIPLLCIISFILWGDYFLDFQKENKNFNKTFFRNLPKDKVLAGLIYKPMYRGKYTYIHFPDYYITWHHGIETSHIAYSYPLYRLKRKVNTEELPHSYEWVGTTKKYDGRFNNMDYLLLKGMYPDNDAEEINNNFNILRRNDDWILFTAKHNQE